MMMELNAQTVKWFKLSDELLDPLTSLGALTPSLKARFSLFPPGGSGPVLGLETLVVVVLLVLLVIMVWMGSWLDEKRIAVKNGRKDGRMDVERRVTPGTCQRKTE